MYRFVVIEKVKGQIFGSAGLKQVKMIKLLLAVVSKCASSKYNEKSK